MDTAANCTTKYKFAYVDRLEPKHLAPALAMGDLIHAGQEAIWRGGGIDESIALIRKVGQDQLTAGRATVDECADRMESAIAITQRYIDKWGVDAVVGDVKDVERLFIVELGDGVTLTARIDVITCIDGELHIFDHKSTGRIRSNYADKLLIDRQIPTYVAAVLAATGRRVRRVHHNIISKAVPSPPHLLSGGTGLSKSRSHCTTVDIYRREIDRYGFNPDEYADHLRWLASNGPRLFERVEHEVSDDQLLDWQRDTSALVSMIRRSIETGEWYRNQAACNQFERWPGDTQYKCDFAELCPAGYDNEHVRRLSFRVATSKGSLSFST